MRLKSLCLSVPFVTFSINAQYTIEQSFPPNANYVEISPKVKTLLGDDMDHSGSGKGTAAVIYTFRYYQIDMFGNEMGDPLTIISRNNPIRGVSSN